MKYARQWGLEQIVAFGIECRLLAESDLVLVCKWRNAEEIRPFMDDERFVTSQVMKVWFNRMLNSDTALPYVVYWEKEFVGYMEVKNIKRDVGTAEVGIFLFGRQCFGTGIASRIALCWEIIASRLGLKTFISRIHSDNIRSIQYFKKLGSEYDHTDGDFVVYKLKVANRREALKNLALLNGMQNEFTYYFGNCSII